MTLKKMMFVLVVALFFAPNTNIASAAETTDVFLNNQKLTFEDAKPFIEDGRVLLPIRSVQESMGAEMKWNPVTDQVYSVKQKASEQTSVLYSIDSTFVYKKHSTNQGASQYLEKIDVPAMIKGGRTYIPLRSAIETFGFKVTWDPTEKNVYMQPQASIKPKSSETQYRVDGDISKVKEIEKEIFHLTNQQRIKNGLKPLILDVQTTKIAQLKSKDFHENNYFDHQSPTYGSPFEMMKQFGIDYAYAGENIAAGYQSAKAVVQGWMKSPGHRENILKPEYKRLGVGYYEGTRAYRTYYTQIFMTKMEE
ncbi:stalk domain-containing protein [Bacillus tianshenii]|nr:stalk domain-containing protein [Bacillus tianshenii]